MEKKKSNWPPVATDNIGPNKQTRKMHFSYNDMYSNKLKAATIIEAWRETGKPQHFTKITLLQEGTHTDAM